jgi:ABC-2 type transport system permease protein
MAESIPPGALRRPDGAAVTQVLERAPLGLRAAPRFSRFAGLIGMLSFFFKELNEIRRQPRLVLSLLLGPFLVLMLFGLGYRGGQPTMRAAIVIPPDLAAVLPPERLAELGGTNFNLLSVGEDREAAMEMLRRGEVDVVQVFPAGLEEQVRRGEQAPVEFASNEINPLNEQWIQYLAYAEIVEINRALLTQNVATLQAESDTLLGELGAIRQQLTTIEQGGQSLDEEELRELSRRLRTVSSALAVGAIFSGSEGAATRTEIEALRADLDALDASLARGDLAASLAQVTATRQRIEQVEGQVGALRGIPPNVIVSPLAERYQNLSGTSYDLMTFYAPSVLALLIQHIAVTLGALALVRERLLGAVDLFRVAPVGLSHVLVGKILCYTAFIGVMAGLLLALMPFIGVPILGNPWLLAGLIMLLTLASLGIGLLISALSRSESQAVQLSMFVLLLSVFFSGFFLPLQNFWEPVRVVGYGLPLTHGIEGLLRLMLRGASPALFTWAGLGIIAVVTLVLAPIIERRELSKI